MPNIKLFYAGAKTVEGNIVTSGGRVLSVTGSGSSINEARSRSYNAVGKISFADMIYRTDIAQKAIG